MQTPYDARIDIPLPELHRHGIAALQLHALGHGKRICRLCQRQYYIGRLYG